MADLDYSLKWHLGLLHPVKGSLGVAVGAGLPQPMCSLWWKKMTRKKMTRKQLLSIIPHAFAKQSQFHPGLALEYEPC
jgi:hypothetical protein